MPQHRDPYRPTEPTASAGAVAARAGGLVLLPSLAATLILSAMLGSSQSGHSPSWRLTGQAHWIRAGLNVYDGMHRTVRAGFGIATLGGRYTTASGRHAHFDVRNDRGVIGPVAAGSAASATLGSVRARDERVALTFSVVFPRGASMERVAAQARGTPHGGYRAAVYVGAHGGARLAIIRENGGHFTRLGPLHRVMGSLHRGSRIRVELLAAGQAPVQLKARAWVVGATMPGWQLQRTDASASRIAQAGNVGIRVSTPVRSRAASVRVTYLAGWALHRVVASQGGGSAASSSGAASSSAPTSPVPSASVAAPSPAQQSGRGSLPVGAAAYPMPGTAIVVAANGADSNPGTLAAPLRTVKAAVARASAGQTIVLRAGTYHESLTIASGKDVTIQNYPNEAVWFDGSMPVTNWVNQGSTWVRSGWTATFDHSASYTSGSDAGGWVNPSYPMAAWPDEVFLDGAQLRQVSSAQTPAPGQFAVDYTAHTLTIGSDPTGHAMRASNLSTAFTVAGRLTLRGVGVRRYATPMPQIGTIYFGGSTGGDALENVVVSDNATQGIGVGVKNCTLNHVTSSHNGLMGVAGNRADDLAVRSSDLDYNNAEHFNSAPSSGGIKISRSANVTVVDNNVIGNYGSDGIWTDISTNHFTIVDNTVVGSSTAYGILTELSDTGIVADNTISNARYGYTAYNTGDVQVYNNSFSNDTVWDVGLSQDARRNTDPATMTTVPWLVRNVVVANNLFGTTASFQFYALDKQTNIAVSDMNVVLNGNLFPTNATHPVMVGWGGNDNTTVKYYRSPAALDSGLGVSWVNAAATVDPAAVTGTVVPYAVPLPSDVAGALGVPVGTQRIGAF